MVGGGIFIWNSINSVICVFNNKGPQGQEKKRWMIESEHYSYMYVIWSISPSNFSRHNKSRIVHESPKPVTALEFRTQGKHIYLFVVTEACVVSINISGKQDVKVIMIYILQYFHVYFYWNPNNLLSYQFIFISKYDSHQYFQVDFYRNQNYQLSLFIFLQRIYWI